MGKRTCWTDEYYVTIYQLTKEGMTRNDIARQLGVNPETLKSWYADKPALRDAVKRAREQRGETAGTSREEAFFAYIYRRLPPELAELWDELKRADKENNFEKRLEIMLERGGLRARQHLWFHALVCSNFNAAEACRRVNVTYGTWKHWAATDPDFLALIDTVKEIKKDMIESALLGAVAAGEVSAIVFASKTLNRDRGYDPRVTVKHEGGILHGHVNLAELDLDLDSKRKLLDAVRAKNVKQLPAATIPVPDAEIIDAVVEEDE